jgi:SPP1 gp7 family putative phage head morphogenesis protein
MATDNNGQENAPSVTLQLDIITPNAGVLRTTMLNTPMQGAPLADWIAELEEADVRRANRVITNGILTGKSSDEIATELLGSKSLQYKDGVRTVTERGAEALVRTATNHAASVGRQSVWEENVDIVDKVRWVSTLDSRTSPVCRERDGKTYPVDKGPRPPAHIRCRSTTVAVVKSWEELGFAMEELDAGTRASINGQVPADMTYYDWLSTQSAATQKDVLGATRYDLWKKGGVSPDRFYDDGRYMTLDEMRKSMPDAFAKAGL